MIDLTVQVRKRLCRDSRHRLSSRAQLDCFAQPEMPGFRPDTRRCLRFRGGLGRPPLHKTLPPSFLMKLCPGPRLAFVNPYVALLRRHVRKDHAEGLSLAIFATSIGARTRSCCGLYSPGFTFLLMTSVHRSLPGSDTRCKHPREFACSRS